MKAFLLRFEEQLDNLANGQISFGGRTQSQAVLLQAVRAGTKTFTEVKPESDDKDPQICSCRAFQFEKV